MSSLTPWDHERIVIGHVLVFPDAVKYVLPDLTHDKFLYSTTGQLDSSKDYLKYWLAITHLHLVDKVTITASAVARKMGETGGGGEVLSHLTSLEMALQGYYRIRSFDPQELMRYAELVDKAGVIYRTGIESYKVASILKSPEEFAKVVTSSVGDVTEWLRTYIGKLSSGITNGKPEGYKHISESVEKAKALADRIHSGEQVMLLPVGMPSIRLPVGKLIILMGESSSGKSVITHQMNLGVAIGLKHYGIKGCVCVNSMEEREEPFTLKLAGMLAGVDLEEFQYENGITDREKYRLDRALDYVAELPIYLDTTNILATSVMDFRVSGIHASEKGPVHMMSLDYLERVDLSAEDADNKEQALDRAITHCADIVGITGTTMIVISQVTMGNSGNAKARIAGADGTRGSRSSRFAADAIWEWWNPVESKRAGNDFVVPEGLNGDQPWLLNPKTRFGKKKSPVAFGWQGEYARVFDLALNRHGNSDIILFDHPLPSFEEIEDGGF